MVDTPEATTAAKAASNIPLLPSRAVTADSSRADMVAMAARAEHHLLSGVRQSNRKIETWNDRDLKT